jgi:hypothetical protein
LSCRCLIPAGAFYQVGDITHVTVLSAVRIRQIGLSAGPGLVAAFNVARPVAGTARRVLAQKARYLVRDAIEAFVGRLYFGSVVPLDPTSPSFPAKRRRHRTQSGDDRDAGENRQGRAQRAEKAPSACNGDERGEGGNYLRHTVAHDAQTRRQHNRSGDERQKLRRGVGDHELALLQDHQRAERQDREAADEMSDGQQRIELGDVVPRSADAPFLEQRQHEREGEQW